MRKTTIWLVVLALLLAAFPALGEMANAAVSLDFSVTVDDAGEHYLVRELGASLTLNDNWPGDLQAGQLFLVSEMISDGAGMAEQGYMALLYFDESFTDEQIDEAFHVGVSEYPVLAAVEVAVEGYMGEPLLGAHLDGMTRTPLGSANGYDYALYVTASPLSEFETLAAAYFSDPASLVAFVQPEAYEETFSNPLGNFNTVDLQGGAQTPELLKGSTVTMVYFWATYCPTCIASLPHIAKIAAEYAPEDFQVLGVLTDVSDEDGIQTALDIAEASGVSFTNILVDQAMYSAYVSGIYYVPETLFIDSHGHPLTQGITGGGTEDEWRKLIGDIVTGYEPHEH